MSLIATGVNCVQTNPKSQLVAVAAAGLFVGRLTRDGWEEDGQNGEEYVGAAHDNELSAQTMYFVWWCRGRQWCLAGRCLG